MINLLWLVPLFAVIGIIAATRGYGEPLYTAERWQDVPPAGGE